MINEKSAGVIIFIKEKEIKYLLLHYGLGHWEFVKGKIENNENDKETIIREAKEEVNIEDLKFIPGFKEKIQFFYKKDKELVKKEVIYYLAETKTKEVKLSFEHINYKWLNYEEALKQLTFKNSKEILKKAHEMLTSSLLNY